MTQSTFFDECYDCGVFGDSGMVLEDLDKGVGVSEMDCERLVVLKEKVTAVGIENPRAGTGVEVSDGSGVLPSAKVIYGFDFVKRFDF